MRQICLLCIGLSATVLFAADERLTFADGLFRRGLSEQAAAEYEAFLASPGDTAREALTEARFNLASCYEQTGKHEAARRLYREVVDQAEGDLAAAAKLRLSMSLLDAGLAAEALPLLETLSVAKASTALIDAARYRLALCYELVDRPMDAEALYKFIANRPGEYAAHARLARAGLVAKAGRSEEAEALYREMMTLEEDPARKQEIA